VRNRENREREREMGRAPCCDKANVKRGPWSPEEDAKLKEYIEKSGTGGNWIALPQKAGLKRCGKSCRLRWLNYLRPNIKHGEFSDDEDRIICSLFATIGSRWSIIAAQLAGRTDNDIKNYWNTKLKKKLMGVFPPCQRKSHQVSNALQASSSSSPSSSITSTSSYQGSNSTYYSTPASSFTGLEPPISFTSTLLSSNFSTNAPNNLLIFGSDQASCSSSDGRTNDRDKYEYGVSGSYGELQMGLQNCFYNGVEGNQRFMISNGGGDFNGWIENPLDSFGLEEIKRLISSGSCSNNLLFDEHKTEETQYY